MEQSDRTVAQADSIQPRAAPDPPPVHGNVNRGPDVDADRIWWNIATLILVVAAVLRLYDLDLKPLHHDEGVNWLFLRGLIRPPHTYHYNPTNYHGPTLYYLGWLSTTAIGVTEFALRFGPAVLGIATVALVLNLRRQIGATSALVAAALIALSPGAVYFSRYFIHETLLGCFTVGVVVTGLRYQETRGLRWLMLASACAGLMFATKETALISAVVLTGSAVGAVLFLRLRRSRDVPAPDQEAEVKGPHDGGDLSRKRFTWATAAKRIWWPVLAAVAIFLLVNVLFYSSFFTYWEGVSAALKSFSPWREVAMERHVSIWSTYLRWLWQEESTALLLGAMGVSLAFWRADDKVAVFVALWAVGIFTAYSVIPYKTPWLTLNIVLPLAIVGGYGVEVLRAQSGSNMRAAMVLGAAGFVVVIGYQTVILNFVRYDDDRYPYVYGHTRREALTLVREIERVMQRSGRRQVPTIAITSPDQFPLSWYFRDYPVGYYGQLVPVTDPVVIGSEKQADELQSRLGSTYQRIGAYSLRPGVTLVLFVRQDLLAGEPPFPLSRRTLAEQP
jgi:uncharacterized protein (TIGR03663 family)